MDAELRKALIGVTQRKLNSFVGADYYIMRAVRMMWKPVMGKSLLTGESSADRLIKSFDEVRKHVPPERHREALNLVVQIATKFSPHEIVLGASGKTPQKKRLKV